MLEQLIMFCHFSLSAMPTVYQLNKLITDISHENNAALCNAAIREKCNKQ